MFMYLQPFFERFNLKPRCNAVYVSFKGTSNEFRNPRVRSDFTIFTFHPGFMRSMLYYKCRRKLIQSTINTLTFAHILALQAQTVLLYNKTFCFRLQNFDFSRSLFVYRKPNDRIFQISLMRPTMA